MPGIDHFKENCDCKFVQTDLVDDKDDDDDDDMETCK